MQRLLFALVVALACLCGQAQAQTRQPLLPAISPTDFVEDCIQLYYTGRGYAQAAGYRQQGYDTLKYFVEKCAPDTSFRGAYGAFTDMNGAVQFMGGSKQRYVDYREWLKTVLYLNTVDPKYYCRAVEAIVFSYSSDQNHNEDLASQMTIVQYLIESGKCEMDSATLVKAYDLRMVEWRDRWADTTTVDTNLVKMDTTLPTLEDLDLEILRGPEFASVNADPPSPSLLGVRVLNNPFSTSTEIEYTLGRTAQVELSVYNALGQVVWSKPFGAVEDARMHRLALGAELVPGSYFLRIATMSGDVRTLRVIKN